MDIHTNPSPPETSTPSYWCYNCTRLVRFFDSATDAISCPYCDGGFVEEINSANHGNRHFPTMVVVTGNSGNNPNSNLSRILGFRRNRRNSADRSNIDHIIVLRGSGSGSGSADSETENNNNNAFELYHADRSRSGSGPGSGLRPIPPSESESLMGAGFERLLEQLSQIELTGFGQAGNPPASKSAIESMPVVEIEPNHVESEASCAVCREEFELGSEAREMPCKHIYHENCIVPWLSTRNSCPICRHQMAAEPNQGSEGAEATGLSIWRLPGGVFAVGRFRGERGLQLDGEIGDSDQRGPAIGIRRRGSGLRRLVRKVVSIFRSNGGGRVSVGH